jgi:hypothetical protein
MQPSPTRAAADGVRARAREEGGPRQGRTEMPPATLPGCEDAVGWLEMREGLSLNRQEILKLRNRMSFVMVRSPTNTGFSQIMLDESITVQDYCSGLLLQVERKRRNRSLHAKCTFVIADEITVS